MDEPITTTPQPVVTEQHASMPVTPSPVVQQPPAAPPAAPAVPPTKQKMNTMYLIIAGILCVGILITSMLYLRTTTKPTQVQPVSATPTISPTPTPPPNISKIATTSAFAAYSQEIASFSATLDSFTLQDSSLTPPLMATDLGL